MRFYELLGFTKVVGPVGPEPVAVITHPTGIEINLVLNAGDANVPNPLMDVEDKLPGHTHIALICEDLESAEEALVEAGFPLSGKMTLPFGMRAIFVRDPDRNVIELDWWPDDIDRRQAMKNLAKDEDAH